MDTSMAAKAKVSHVTSFHLSWLHCRWPTQRDYIHMHPPFKQISVYSVNYCSVTVVSVVIWGCHIYLYSPIIIHTYVNGCKPGYVREHAFNLVTKLCYLPLIFQQMDKTVANWFPRKPKVPRQILSKYILQIA